MERDKLLIGRKPVLDALFGDSEIEKVWIDRDLRGDFEKEVRRKSQVRNIPLQYVPKQKLNSLTDKANHQGIVAQLSLVKYWQIEALLPFMYEQGTIPKILVLDGVEDVRNIGALSRSAVWFGMDAIVISAKKSAMINSFAYKSSAGAIKDIPICREPNLQKSVKYMKGSGLQIITAEMRNKSNDKELDYNAPLALILGSEGSGISREMRNLADFTLNIPGTGKVESLNVSVAGAILMHEIYVKQQSQN